MQATTDYLDRPEAAEHCHISQRFLDELRARGEIPFIRLSRRKILFRRADLDRFMASRRVDATRKGAA